MSFPVDHRSAGLHVGQSNRVERDGDEGARSAALDIKEVNGVKASKCTCGPLWMRLRNNTTGELIKPRGRCVNRCDYCATLAAIENSEMLALDALMGVAPTIYAVTTTPNIEQDTRQYREVIKAFVKALRREFLDIEYGCIIEFTTGRAGTSGGHRRPHWNWFFKGVGAADVERLRTIIERNWCPAMNANPGAQYVGEIKNEGGLFKYLALHFYKENQQTPEGWRGHKLRLSRGYLCKPTPEMREMTRRAIEWKREMYKAEKRGLQGEEAESYVTARIEFQHSCEWERLTAAEWFEYCELRPWLAAEPAPRMDPR